MRRILFTLPLAMIWMGLEAQQSVRTGSGDEYILYPNGTWGKVAESPHGKKVILLSNGTWKEYDLGVTNNTTNPNNTTTHPNNTNPNPNPINGVVDNPNAPMIAQATENVLTIWKNSRVIETIKMEYESDLKGGYFYAIGCAPYRYDKASGEVRFMVTEVVGKAANVAEAQSLMGNHYVEKVYKNMLGKFSSDGTTLTLQSGGNDLRKVAIQRVTDLATDNYIYTLEGNAFRYDRKTGDVKLPTGEVLAKSANEKEAKNMIAYYFIYKKG